MTKLHMLMLLSLLFAYLVYLQANEHYNAFFHGKPLDKKFSLVCSIAYGICRKDHYAKNHDRPLGQ